MSATKQHEGGGLAWRSRAFGSASGALAASRLRCRRGFEAASDGWSPATRVNSRRRYRHARVAAACGVATAAPAPVVAA